MKIHQSLLALLLFVRLFACAVVHFNGLALNVISSERFEEYRSDLEVVYTNINSRNNVRDFVNSPTIYERLAKTLDQFVLNQNKVERMETN